MSNKFEFLINSFIQNKIGIDENFIHPTLSASLRNNLLELFSKNEFHLAGTGNDIIDDTKLYRSDSIHWLDRLHNNEHEHEFFDLMDEFIIYLNESCYAGIKSYEFHYTLYPAGSFYKRHLDQFRNDGSRKYSMIMYLNIDWQKGDGGELRIYQDSFDQDVTPTNGKTVFFKSVEMEHEVLLTHKARLSITGWLKS